MRLFVGCAQKVSLGNFLMTWLYHTQFFTVALKKCATFFLNSASNRHICVSRWWTCFPHAFPVSALQDISVAAFLSQRLAHHSWLKTILIETSTSWRSISTAELFVCGGKKILSAGHHHMSERAALHTKCPPLQSLVTPIQALSPAKNQPMQIRFHWTI